MEQGGALRLYLPEGPADVYPQDGVTKLQLAEYFAAVGEVAMPHYEDRPLSILRNTHGAQPFFQKHFLEESSAGLRIVRISNAGLRESHTHDVGITRESPNYPGAV